ncbi:MAG: hypothetical protein GY714_06950 [Desulfobacterales bacterium]|nr:hypothetical protein [Desulfobacterales bacterium]
MFNKLFKSLGKIQAINMAITIISVALLVITLTLLLNKILKPIKETVAALEDISKGDLLLSNDFLLVRRYKYFLIHL